MLFLTILLSLSALLGLNGFIHLSGGWQIHLSQEISLMCLLVGAVSAGLMIRFISSSSRLAWAPTHGSSCRVPQSRKRAIPSARASACVVFANVSLVKGSHMANRSHLLMIGTVTLLRNKHTYLGRIFGQEFCNLSHPFQFFCLYFVQIHFDICCSPISLMVGKQKGK